MGRHGSDLALTSAVLVAWDPLGHLPLPLGVAGHEGSTVIVGLDGLRLLTDSARRKARGTVPGVSPRASI